jgi:4-diphosphocytidyl-2-C-methyl-D-erythritol kinase
VSGSDRPDRAQIQEFAPAKINLTLHVTGRRGDGYHLLDSLVVFADTGDWLAAAPAPVETLSLRIEGPCAGPLRAEPAEDNLIMRAARALQAWAKARGLPGRGAALTLDKRLPVASGIGGGSADAAAALRALVRLWALDIPDKDLSQIALGLGADVPVCLQGRAAIMRGIGEDIAPAPPLPEMWLVLANPGVPVSTGGVFRLLDIEAVSALGVPSLPGRLVSAGEAAEVLRRARNDLEAPARALAPEVGEVLNVLDRTQGALMARMSGSGATCFALYADENAARAAARALEAEHPGWWVTAAKMRA